MTSTITIALNDDTGLAADEGTTWVCGWINGNCAIGGTVINNVTYKYKVLRQDGCFASPTAKDLPVPFFKVSDIPNVTLDEVTCGNERLVFVVSKDRPDPLTVATSSGEKQTPIQFSQYPYLNAPGVAAPGPFDVLEFGMNAQFNLSAVSGFGVNLSFTAQKLSYGVDTNVTRGQIAEAFKAFIENEAKAHPPAAAFAELLYDAPISKGAPTPPMIANQFFAISDPNDMLNAKYPGYVGSGDDPLASFWDETLTKFFAEGNALSINLGSDATPNIYSGTASKKINPQTKVETYAYHLANAKQGYDFFMPLANTGDPSPGLTGAQYVFQQAFGSLTPAGSAGDAGLLQDTLWEALCRGVAMNGVSRNANDTAKQPGFSTAAWNNWKTWYAAGSACHYYAKFLHCSDVDGNDCRLSGKKPIFYGGAAYGFSMDENPDGPYEGPNVPSKTKSNIGSGTVKVTLGKWALVPTHPSHQKKGHQPTSGTYEFGIGDNSAELGPIKIGDYVYNAGSKGGFGGFLPDLPDWTKMEFSGLGPDHYIWIKNGHHEAGGCLSAKPQWNATPRGGESLQWPAGLAWVAGKTPPAKPNS